MDEGEDKEGCEGRCAFILYIHKNQTLNPDKIKTVLLGHEKVLSLNFQWIPVL